MDDGDMARRYADLYLGVAMRNHRAARGVAGNASSSECADCGEPIPLARQLAAPGCTRCVMCQRDHERNGRGG